MHGSRESAKATSIHLDDHLPIVELDLWRLAVGGAPHQRSGNLSRFSRGMLGSRAIWIKGKRCRKTVPERPLHETIRPNGLLLRSRGLHIFARQGSQGYLTQ